MHSVDISNAYLNGIIPDDNDLYMRIGLTKDARQSFANERRAIPASGQD